MNTKTIAPRVLEVHPNRQGSLRAFITLQIGPLVIYRARYIRQDGQKGYVAPPQEVVTGPDGGRKFLPSLKWPEEWKQPILEVVRAAVAEAEEKEDIREDIEEKWLPERQRNPQGTSFGAEVRHRANLPPSTGDEDVF